LPAKRPAGFPDQHAGHLSRRRWRRRWNSGRQSRRISRRNAERKSHWQYTRKPGGNSRCACWRNARRYARGKPRRYKHRTGRDWRARHRHRRDEQSRHTDIVKSGRKLQRSGHSAELNAADLDNSGNIDHSSDVDHSRQ